VDVAAHGGSWVGRRWRGQVRVRWGCSPIPRCPLLPFHLPVRNEDRERAWRASRETKLETIPNCEAW